MKFDPKIEYGRVVVSLSPIVGKILRKIKCEMQGYIDKFIPIEYRNRVRWFEKHYSKSGLQAAMWSLGWKCKGTG